MTKMVNWNDLPREFVRRGIERCGFRGEDVMLVFNFAEPDLQVKPHQHDFEQVVICVEGEMNYHVAGEVFEMKPGSMLRVPPHTMHHAEMTGGGRVLNLDVFSPLREDYRHLVEYQADEFENAPARS